MDNMKENLVKHLKGGEAFMPVDKMIEKIPFLELGKRPAGLPYSFFEIFSHIRFTQKDILDYCTQTDYKAPEWPKDYWPEKSSPDDEHSWKELVSGYFRERLDLETLIISEETVLTNKVPSGGNHTIFREVLLVIDHTAYHSGQLLILLRHLGLHSS
jgi:uncharacterized damage-inducible protein DinB